MIRNVSFHDISTVTEFKYKENNSVVYNTYEVKIPDEETKTIINNPDPKELSSTKYEIENPDGITTDIKFNRLDLNKHIFAVKSYIYDDSQNNKKDILKTALLIKKSVVFILEKSLLNQNIEPCNIKAEDFLLYISETTGYDKRQYQRNDLNTFEGIEEKVETEYHKLKKKPTKKNLQSFYKKNLKYLTQLNIFQSDLEDTLLKYIVAIIFNKFLIKPNSQYNLLNIIAQLILELDMFYDIESKISIVEPVLNDIIDFLINHDMTTSSDINTYLVSENNKQLLGVVNFLEKNLTESLKTSAFLSLYIQSNKNKIKKLRLSSSAELDINSVKCQYEKTWGAVSLLERNKKTHEIKFSSEDSALAKISQDSLNEELKLAANITIVQTEDYNIQNDRVPDSIKSTNCLFKTIFSADNKTYYSGIRFGLTDPVYMNDNIFTANKNHIHIAEKLIKASVMTMSNATGIVNAGIDAFNYHHHEKNPEVHVISVTITSNKTEINEALKKYNETMSGFNDKNHSFETALYKLGLIGNNKFQTKLIADTIFIDLKTKILSFNFLENNNNEELSSNNLDLFNNELALQNMLGELIDAEDFTSIKLLQNIIDGNLNLLQLNNDKSLLADFCKKTLADHVNLEGTEDITIDLPNEFKTHLNKLLVLTKNIEIGYKNNNYNTYMFAAHILLLSNLIGGSQLSCCENGLTKTGCLDNHIKWLASELFVNENLSINIETSAIENELYKQIEEISINKEEDMLFY